MRKNGRCKSRVEDVGGADQDKLDPGFDEPARLAKNMQMGMTGADQDDAPAHQAETLAISSRLRVGRRRRPRTENGRWRLGIRPSPFDRRPSIIGKSGASRPLGRKHLGQSLLA